MPGPRPGIVASMTNYTDQDLADAYARLSRALDIHRMALRDRPLDFIDAEHHHQERLRHTRDTYNRCFNRYMAIAAHLAAQPLSRRPQPS